MATKPNETVDPLRDDDLEPVADETANRARLVVAADGRDSAVREVFSPAARVPDGGFDAPLSDMLLRDSQSNILGAWEIAGDVLFYVIKLHDDADGARIEQPLEAAAQLADDMELRLGGDDVL